MRRNRGLGWVPAAVALVVVAVGCASPRPEERMPFKDYTDDEKAEIREQAQPRLPGPLELKVYTDDEKVRILRQAPPLRPASREPRRYTQVQKQKIIRMAASRPGPREIKAYSDEEKRRIVSRARLDLMRAAIVSEETIVAADRKVKSTICRTAFLESLKGKGFRIVEAAKAAGAVAADETDAKKIVAYAKANQAVFVVLLVAASKKFDERGGLRVYEATLDVKVVRVIGAEHEMVCAKRFKVKGTRSPKDSVAAEGALRAAVKQAVAFAADKIAARALEPTSLALEVRGLPEKSDAVWVQYFLEKKADVNYVALTGYEKGTATFEVRVRDWAVGRVPGYLRALEDARWKLEMEVERADAGAARAKMVRWVGKAAAAQPSRVTLEVRGVRDVSDVAWLQFFLERNQGVLFAEVTGYDGESGSAEVEVCLWGGAENRIRRTLEALEDSRWRMKIRIDKEARRHLRIAFDGWAKKVDPNEGSVLEVRDIQTTDQVAWLQYLLEKKPGVNFVALRSLDPEKGWATFQVNLQPDLKYRLPAYLASLADERWGMLMAVEKKAPGGVRATFTGWEKRRGLYRRVDLLVEGLDELNDLGWLQFFLESKPGILYVDWDSQDGDRTKLEVCLQQDVVEKMPQYLRKLEDRWWKMEFRIERRRQETFHVVFDHWRRK